MGDPYDRSCHLEVSLLFILTLGKANGGRDERIPRDETVWESALPHRFGNRGALYGIRWESSLCRGVFRYWGWGAFTLPGCEGEKSGIDPPSLLPSNHQIALQASQILLADSPDAHQLLNVPKTSFLGSVFDDPPGQFGTDAGYEGQVFFLHRIEIQGDGEDETLIGVHSG